KTSISFLFHNKILPNLAIYRRSLPTHNGYGLLAQTIPLIHLIVRMANDVYYLRAYLVHNWSDLTPIGVMFLIASFRSFVCRKSSFSNCPSWQDFVMKQKSYCSFTNGFIGTYAHMHT